MPQRPLTEERDDAHHRGATDDTRPSGLRPGPLGSGDGMSTSRRLFLTGLATAAGTAACTSATERPQGASSSPAAAPHADPSIKRPPTSSAKATSASPTPLTPGPDVVHGPRDVPAVALTFHGAGDPRLCREVLARVADAGVQVTVLAVGSWLGENPALARAMADAGHELGNHTWSHLPMRRLGVGEAHREVQRAADVLEQLTGSPGRWFRPSGTPRSTSRIRAAAADSGYARCLAYDVDPLHYTDPGGGTVTRRLLGAVRPGSIVSLHLGHAGTVSALPDVLAGLVGKGLHAVTASELLR